jgi:hypothetical protein
MTLKELRVFFPSEGSSPRSPTEPFFPGAPDAPIELPQTAIVGGTAIVLVVTSEFRVEHDLLLVHGVVSMYAAPFSDPFEGPPQALFHRLDMNRELPSPATHTLMGEAEEIEGLSLRPRPARSRQGLTPELHESRLLRMEGQSVPCESLGK